MANHWYYVHGATGNGATRNGPFSDRELANLAGAGQILPADTVWKEGVAQGVLARRVKYLFPTAPTLSSGSAGVGSSRRNGFLS